MATHALAAARNPRRVGLWVWLEGIMKLYWDERGGEEESLGMIRFEQGSSRAGSLTVYRAGTLVSGNAQVSR